MCVCKTAFAFKSSDYIYTTLCVGGAGRCWDRTQVETVCKVCVSMTPDPSPDVTAPLCPPLGCSRSPLQLTGVRSGSESCGICPLAVLREAPESPCWEGEKCRFPVGAAPELGCLRSENRKRRPPPTHCTPSPVGEGSARDPRGGCGRGGVR